MNQRLTRESIVKDSTIILKFCPNLVFLAKDIKAILKIRILTKSQNGWGILKFSGTRKYGVKIQSESILEKDV